MSTDPNPAPLRLRQGRRNGHTLYWQEGSAPSDTDRFAGSAVTPEDAARIVEAVNAPERDDQAQQWEEGRRHGLRQAWAPQRGREKQLEAEIESMLIIEEANSTAWQAKCERVRELEAEVERLRETLARARVFVWELEPSGDWLRAEHRGGDAWRITRDGDEVAVVTGQEEALDRARQIAEEEDPQ